MLYIKSIDPLLSISRYYKDCGHFANADIHWFGECAKHFGLTGDVNKELLKILLAGKLPSEKRVVKNYNFQENLLGGIGYELMFVAMKSISMLALEDSKVISAHKQAVIATLQHIEKKVVAVVKRENYFEGRYTRNLLAACFHHLGGNANNYKLHSHCLVFNVTAADELYLELEPDIFMVAMHEFGARYRAELAKILTCYGYNLEQVNDDGFFNITGNTVRTMSKC